MKIRFCDFNNWIICKMYARVYIVDNACKLAQDAFLSFLRNDCSLRDVSTCVLVLILQNLDAINKPVFFVKT